MNLQLPLETSQQERKYQTTLPEISGERERKREHIARRWEDVLGKMSQGMEGEDGEWGLYICLK